MATKNFGARGPSASKRTGSWPRRALRTALLAGFAAISAPTWANADELAYPATPPEPGSAADAADRSQALARTQADLADPSRRAAVIAADPGAAAADARVRGLTGGDPALDQDVYALAADILPTIEAQAGGDPRRMQALLERAIRDPQGFAAQLTPAQRQRLENTSRQIEDRRATGN